jgi:hypothetical protein
MNEHGDTTTTDDADARLLGELRRAAALLDPVPDRLLEFGRASLAWRTVDAELAALLSDSTVDDERLALVRSATGVRAVTFEAGGLTIEVDVLDEGRRRTIVGQLVPPAAAAIEVQTAEQRTTVEADEQGLFRAEGIPAGQMRLQVTGHPAAARPIVTSWITI